MERLECSVWNKGHRGWGLKVLGSLDVRREYFDRNLGCVALLLDGAETWVNIDKPGFWNAEFGELFSKQIGEYVERHHLQPSDKVWLKVIDPHERFEAELA